MSDSSMTRPLAHDFAERLDAVRLEAATGGHTDLDHLLEMAVAIARRRIEGQATMCAPVDSEILRPHAPESATA